MSITKKKRREGKVKESIQQEKRNDSALKCKVHTIKIRYVKSTLGIANKSNSKPEIKLLHKAVRGKQKKHYININIFQNKCVAHQFFI